MRGRTNPQVCGTSLSSDADSRPAADCTRWHLELGLVERLRVLATRQQRDVECEMVDPVCPTLLFLPSRRECAASDLKIKPFDR